jgi:hypothetical protein
MIQILAPNEGGRSQDQNINDARTGTWRINFYDSNSDKVKEAYIGRTSLKFKTKIDYKNIEVVRNYLEKWAEKYLQDKTFDNLEDCFEIKL